MIDSNGRQNGQDPGQSNIERILESEVRLQLQEDLEADTGDIYEEALPDARSADPDSGGQSGDTQGLSDHAEAGAMSVAELAEAGQGYEADLITGIEEAADHPEQPLRVHERETPPAF